MLPLSTQSFWVWDLSASTGWLEGELEVAHGGLEQATFPFQGHSWGTSLQGMGLWASVPSRVPQRKRWWAGWTASQCGQGNCNLNKVVKENLKQGGATERMGPAGCRKFLAWVTASE